MKQNKTTSCEGGGTSFEQEVSRLMQEQLLFTENVFTRLPMGVEIYDADGVLRRINDYAMKMYGVDDRAAVIGSVNLFKSPYCDEELQKKIRAGEEITLEFEYDFERINSDAYFASHNRNSMIYEVRIVPVRNKDKIGRASCRERV